MSEFLKKYLGDKLETEVKDANAKMVKAFEHIDEQINVITRNQVEQETYLKRIIDLQREELDHIKALCKKQGVTLIEDNDEV